MTTGKWAMKIPRRFNVTHLPHEMTEALTPPEKVFVVCHIGVPDMDSNVWSLSVRGLVDRALNLSLAELKAMQQVTVEAIHECAGSPANPKVPVRRIANIRWTGVRLRDVLDRAGLAEEAKFVWATGADSGIYDPTKVHLDFYQKDLPMDKARADEVLLAMQLNGQPIDDQHGGPVRLVVPGWYGTNSVKWVTELEVRPARSEAYFVKTLYNEKYTENGEEKTRSVWGIAPHSIIVAPAKNTTVPFAPRKIWGWAWGEHPIRQLEVSTDDGATWLQAALAPREGITWQSFSFDWTPRERGVFKLACRATDIKGVCQPDQEARNEVHRVEVTVE